jgi:hypothetical protein
LAIFLVIGFIVSLRIIWIVPQPKILISDNEEDHSPVHVQPVTPSERV